MIPPYGHNPPRKMNEPLDVAQFDARFLRDIALLEEPPE